jgi:hypothetical protein
MIYRYTMAFIATIAFICGLLLTTTGRLEAGLLTIRFGPPSPGNGGANPLGIPPSALDMELDWMTSTNWETSLAAVPGILFGKRFDMGSFYTSIGGGLIISANGPGIGPYSAFGWESEGTYRFSFEYKQALGLTTKGLVSPYALRFGVGYVFQ